MRVLVGSYTGDKGGGRGVTTYEADLSAGRYESVGICEMDSASWLTRHPTLPVVYATNETADGRVTVLRLDGDGRPTVVAEHPTGGADPCHLALDAQAHQLFAANYTGGTVAAFDLDDTGAITRAQAVEPAPWSGPGPVRDRQEAPHPHQVVGERGRMRVVDLGRDSVDSYDVAGSDPVHTDSRPLPPGTGPRQLAGVPGGRSLVAGELGATLLLLDQRLAVLDSVRSTATEPDVQSFPAQLLLGDNRLVYLTNRGADCVTVFRIEDDRIVPVIDVPTVAWPRHAALVGDHLLVCGQRADTVDILRLDGDGVPRPTGHRIDVPAPAFVLPL